MVGKVRALTSEGRLQAVILSILPLGAFVAIYVLNRSYAQLLLDRPRLLVAVLVSQALGHSVDSTDREFRILKRNQASFMNEGVFTVQACTFLAVSGLTYLAFRGIWSLDKRVRERLEGLRHGRVLAFPRRPANRPREERRPQKS